MEVGERLAKRIIDDQKNVITDLDVALGEGTEPLDIINNYLLGGMRTVGDLFASGEMQLPFVLKSAETMKKAVAYLEPMMEKAEGSTRGRIVLATVSGDVHDIGKNLVDIILTNNGYEVHNLGIKIGISEMIAKFEETSADAIGMSGLLVKSTLIARQPRGVGATWSGQGSRPPRWSRLDQELRRSRSPISLQGPATTARTLSPGSRPWGRSSQGASPRAHRRPAVSRAGYRGVSSRPGRPTSGTIRSSSRPSPGPGDPGSLDRRDRPYLNLTALFRNQWQYRPEKGGAGPRFQGTVGAAPPSRSPWLVMTTCSTPRWSTGTSRRTATATTSSSGTTSVPGERPGSASPSAGRSIPVHRRLLPTGRRRGRLRRLPHRHDGRQGF